MALYRLLLLRDGVSPDISRVIASMTVTRTKLHGIPHDKV